MKYEDFISKLNELHENLTNQLKTKHNDFLSMQNGVIDKLMNNIVQEKESLGQLEASLSKNEEEKNQHISTIKSIITHLKGELENDLANQKASYNSKEFHERLISQKEEVLSGILNPKRKEVEALKQKINTLDRECLLNLKAKAVEFEEEEKNLKLKIADIEKRLKFEIQKISDAILIPIKEDGDNTENQAITDPEEIKAIRLKGLNDIVAIKKKYSNEIKQAELNFNNYQGKFKLENDILREEYNLKIEELKFVVNKRQIEIQAELDLYDLQSYKKVNQYERDNEQKFSDTKFKYQAKITSYQDNVIKVDYEKNDVHWHNMRTVLDELKEIDINQVDGFNTLYEENENILNLLKTSLLNMLENYQEFMITVFNEYWESYATFLKRMVNIFMMNKYNSFSLNNFTYDKNYKLINRAVNNFLNLEKNMFNDYLHMITNWFYDINKKVQELHQLHMKHQKIRSDKYEEFAKELKRLVNQAQTDGVTHLQEKNTEALKLIEDKKLSYKTENEIYIKEVNDNLNAAYLKFKEIDDKLNRNIEEVNQKKVQDLEKLKLEYQNNLKTIKENISKIKLKAKKDLKIKEKEINQKYENEFRDIDEEYKTKIKIGLS